MDACFDLTPSAAHPETMDFLSRTWCDFAVQTLQPELQDRSLVLVDSPVKDFETKSLPPPVKMEETADFKSSHSWKSDDVKSWIWMQQAMHPELNYSSYFRKKWVPWKLAPFKYLSIKKWIKEMKQKRKEEERLQRAEVHAAISVAGLAAALAAIASENSENSESRTGKEAAVASAAALVAAQCAHVAEAMGAKKEQLSTVIGSAMSETGAIDILTLTAAATTSLKGAATLKARSGNKNRISGEAPVLPIEENNETNFDLEKWRSMLAKGLHLRVETPSGKYVMRSVSIIQNIEAKVILKIRKLKLNLLKSTKESIIMDMHVELYKDQEEGDGDSCYLIVLTTSRGTFKLDMEDDYQLYKRWTTAISHMLMLSASITKYDLQF